MQAEISHLHIARCAVAGYAAGMELNLRIREIRKERGMTIAELAELVGVSIPHMSGVERGVKNLNNHLLVRTAEALKVDPDDLISSPDREQLARLITAMKRLSQDDQDRVREFAAGLLLTQREVLPQQ